MVRTGEDTNLYSLIIGRIRLSIRARILQKYMKNSVMKLKCETNRYQQVANYCYTSILRNYIKCGKQIKKQQDLVQQTSKFRGSNRFASAEVPLKSSLRKQLIGFCKFYYGQIFSLLKIKEKQKVTHFKQREIKKTIINKIK